jgi:hypothetical protein
MNNLALGKIINTKTTFDVINEIFNALNSRKVWRRIL